MRDDERRVPMKQMKQVYLQVVETSNCNHFHMEVCERCEMNTKSTKDMIFVEQDMTRHEIFVEQRSHAHVETHSISEYAKPHMRDKRQE